MPGAPPIAPQPDHVFLKHQQKAERQLLTKLHDHPLGQILTDSVADAYLAVKLMCGYYPEARFLFPQMTIEAAQQLRRKIAGDLGGKVGIRRTARHWRPAERLTVCTPDAMTDFCPTDIDFIVFYGLDVVRAKYVRKCCLEQPHRLVNPRRYGIYCGTSELHRAEQLDLQALAGPQIAHFSTLAAQRATLRQVTLVRQDEEDVILVTNLIGSQAMPAEALLEVCLARRSIERVFSSDLGLSSGAVHRLQFRSGLFQFAFCTLRSKI